ncbi:TPA: hypothetical protein I7286_08715 [Vibrio parahaemolyticus]|nr:hypothetical protein [Vibrio parahaemolyticus]
MQDNNSYEKNIDIFYRDELKFTLYLLTKDSEPTPMSLYFLNIIKSNNLEIDVIFIDEKSRLDNFNCIGIDQYPALFHCGFFIGGGIVFKEKVRTNSIPKSKNKFHMLFNDIVSEDKSSNSIWRIGRFNDEILFCGTNGININGTTLGAMEGVSGWVNDFTIINDVVYFGGSSGILYCYDKLSLVEVYRSEVGTWINTICSHKNELYIGLSSGFIVVISNVDNHLFKYKLSCMEIWSIIFFEGFIYAGLADGTLFKLNLTNGDHYKVAKMNGGITKISENNNRIFALSLKGQIYDIISTKSEYLDPKCRYWEMAVGERYLTVVCNLGKVYLYDLKDVISVVELNCISATSIYIHGEEILIGTLKGEVFSIHQDKKSKRELLWK